MKFAVNKSPSEWKALLSDEEYRVLIGRGTERPGTGKLNKFYPTEGHFQCVGCGNPLYSAKAKFDSGCGWPAFDSCFDDSIVVVEDKSGGMVRKEIICKNCGGHLGHVFSGEKMTPTNERHCANSVCLKYVKGK
eukprot:GHVR01134939.1.p1 GENE.GHVR01134939.1~~GHVR01134939.1.p1  ORF type:complete len:134 (+),score=23.38 GHVR01134939.1:181-582(+)